jgi:hypothetical protein
VLTIEQCKNKLNKKKKQLKSEDIKNIQALLYQFAHIEFSNYKKLKTCPKM